jgi:DNA modification methylase
MILIGDVKEKLRELPDNSVHCVVTSPPYWGLRDYQVVGQLGLEPTLQEYIANMVEVFEGVRRVLRDDGVCFVNMGDSYLNVKVNRPSFIKPKDLCGVPWRLAFALQDAGWWLRSDIIWAKPNPMPESVTDRPTKSHEYIFLLTKSSKYFWDQEAVREKVGIPTRRMKIFRGGCYTENRSFNNNYDYSGHDPYSDGNKSLSGRNLRTVWTIPTHSFPGAHFATFPPKLVVTCIKAGTSEWGCCPECGKAWVRVVEKDCPKDKKEWHSGWGGRGFKGEKHKGSHTHSSTESITLGFRQTCTCPEATPVPCTVLDPFLGSGTVGLVAKRMMRNWIGIELKPEYAEMARIRTSMKQNYFIV